MFGMIKRPPDDKSVDEILGELFGERLKELNEDEGIPDAIKSDLSQKFKFLEGYLTKILRNSEGDERIEAILAFQAAVQLGVFSVNQIIKKPTFFKVVRQADLKVKRLRREADYIDIPIKKLAMNLWRRKPSRKNNAHATATDIVEPLYVVLKNVPNRPKAWKKDLRIKKEKEDAIKAVASRIRKIFR